MSWISSKNKKVNNATIVEYQGKKFRSKLELFAFKELEKSELHFLHEGIRFNLLQGFYLENTELWCLVPEDTGKKDKNGKKINKDVFKQDTRKVMSWTYTPDFIIHIEELDLFFVIETKGSMTDTYPLKRKMFLKVLETKYKDYKTFFLEPHNQKQVLKSIELIHGKIKEYRDKTHKSVNEQL